VLKERNLNLLADWQAPMASSVNRIVCTTAPEQSVEANDSIFEVCAFTDPTLLWLTIVQVPAAEVGTYKVPFFWVQALSTYSSHATKGPGGVGVGVPVVWQRVLALLPQQRAENRFV
jgi:hypothetical protein